MMNGVEDSGGRGGVCRWCEFAGVAWISVLLGGLLSAAETPLQGVHLGEAEILKIDWDTRSLRTSDLDGDGLTDLALINNEQARIEVFFQLADGEQPGRSKRKTSVDRWEPVVEDARFESQRVLTGGIAYDLAIGDLNDDGRADLIYSNDRDELVVHLQDDPGDWTKKSYHECEDLASFSDSLWVGDLFGEEGGDDVVCLTENGLMIFPGGDLEQRPRQYTCVRPTPRELRVTDLNGDGRRDLVYFHALPGKKSIMGVRLQGAGQTFVAERLITYERMLGAPVEVNWQLESKRPTFVGVSAANQTLTQLTMEPTERAQGQAAEGDFFREAFAVPTSDDGETHFVVADFTGDGRLDVVASDSAGAQVWFYRQAEDGHLRAPESFPALSAISGLEAGDTNGDGRAELIMVSEDEGVIGVSEFDESERFAYPEVIQVAEPGFLAVADFGGDGRSEIVCSAAGASNRSRSLVLASRDGKTGAWRQETLPGVELGSRLQGLRVVDINQDGHEDILALSRVQALEVILQKEDGTFFEAEGVAGLADKLSPVAVSQGDVDGDGKEEVMVARAGFARSARMNAEGRVEVIDQINAPESSAELLVALPIAFPGQEDARLILVDGEAEQLHLMAKDDKGVYRLQRSHPGVEDVAGTYLGDADADQTPDLFLFGDGHFWWYRLRPDTVRLRESMLHETDLEDTDYGHLMAGRLDGDGVDDLVVFDPVKSHVMEVLLADLDGAQEVELRSTLHFKIFEVDPHFQGQRGSRYQPHATVLDDLNGDGLLDVALLVHDRLLIYPQQKGGDR